MIKRPERWVDRHFKAVGWTIALLFVALPLSWTVFVTVNDVNATLSAYGGASGVSRELIWSYSFFVWAGYAMPVILVLIGIYLALVLYVMIASAVSPTSTKDG